MEHFYAVVMAGGSGTRFWPLSRKTRPKQTLPILGGRSMVRQTVDPGPKIIFGAYHDRNLKEGQIKVTLVATGFSATATNSLFGAGAGVPTRSYLDEETTVRPFASREASEDKVTEKREAYRADHGEFVKEKEPNLPKSSAPGRPAFLNIQKEEKKEDSGSDPWDIPTFLRKRRK